MFCRFRGSYCVAVMSSKKFGATAFEPPGATARSVVATGHRCVSGSVVDVAAWAPSAAMRTYYLTVRRPSFLRPLDALLLAVGCLFEWAAMCRVGGGGGDVGSADVGGEAWLKWGAIDLANVSPATASAVATLVLAFAVVRVVFFLRGTVEESVLAVRGIGLQLTRRNALGQTVSRFIDQGAVTSLFVHEGYFRHQCVFFMGAVVEEQDRTVVFFDETLPRVAVLRTVLRGLREVLYNESPEGPSLAEIEAAGKAAAMPAPAPSLS